MSDERRVARIYGEYVVAPDLERTALLGRVRGLFVRPPAVLYPGCSVHVTPSFHFEHVVYVDVSDLARAFFADEGGVRRLVKERKRYARAPYVRFLGADFTAPLPLPDASVDLLLALYAGGVSRACARYVKPGGLVLTNDHHGDAREAAAVPGLELAAVVVASGGRGGVRLVEDDLDGYLRPAPPRRRGVPGGYARRADCYLFRKQRAMLRPRPRTEGPT